MDLKKNIVGLILWGILTGLFAFLRSRGYDLYTMPGGQTVSDALIVISAAFAGYHLAVVAIRGRIKARHGAPGEVDMLAGLIRVAAGITIAVALLSLFGKLESVGTALGAFSGLLLGWSLQAPVSGMAAWVMISLKRPFRVGDRIQLPSLGLVGDVVNFSPMYTMLNQVGGAVGSEEAVGRPILIPNAMLFSNVVINYTARQDAAFILDEVVVRVTYDTDWRLRFMTKATDRPRISYEITKRVFQDFQRSARVDFAIPYVYSFRKGVQASARYDEAERDRPTVDVPLSQIVVSGEEKAAFLGSEQDILELATRIRAEGLIQPVVLSRMEDGQYQVMAGHMRVEACKRLGWHSLPAVVTNK